MIPFIIGAAIWQNNSIAKYEQASQETLQQAMRIAMEFIREAKTLQTLCKEDEAVAQFAGTKYSSLFKVEVYRITSVPGATVHHGNIQCSCDQFGERSPKRLCYVFHFFGALRWIQTFTQWQYNTK